MNLVTEPWIPVVTHTGEHRLASLMDVFLDGRTFADLAVRPHERIALMRLLICIGQAALDGPDDIDAWDEAPEDLPSAARTYLEKWKESFDLFHPRKPFLQIASLERPAKVNKLGSDEDAGAFTSVSKLDFALATGNNTTLFDHIAAAETDREFPSAALPLMLLTFQSFSPGGTIGVALWQEKPTNGWTSYPKVRPGQSGHAPCLPKNMLHAFVRRETLFDTVCANLLTKVAVAEHFGQDSWGYPVWEEPPTSPDDSEAVQIATRTYLGRLVPLSRCIKLSHDGKELLLANGLEYPSFGNDKNKFPADPSATVILNHDKTDRILLGATTAKAIWRELSALTLSRTKDSPGGALTLRNIPEKDAFDLWAGALIADKASILDTVESVLHVPVQMRVDAGSAAYQAEVERAESMARKLSSAMETSWGEIDGGWEGRLKMAGPKKNNLRRQLHGKAIHHYWTAVEKLRPLLLQHVEAINTTAEAVEQTRSQWRKAIHQAACDAYRLACGQDTPRQVRAFALGWAKLFAKPKNNADKSEDTETETEITEGD